MRLLANKIKKLACERVLILKHRNYSIFNILSSRLFFIATGILLLSFFLPIKGLSFHICPFHWITGVPCIGCGLTRSVSCISRGHFSDSIYYHPFGVFIYLFLIGIIVACLFPGFKTKIELL